MPLSRDEIEVLADAHYDKDTYETRDQQVFAMLVDVAAATFECYLDHDRPNLDDPDSFTPNALGGVNQGWALIQGLIENLEMKYPDSDFRKMGVAGH